MKAHRTDGLSLTFAIVFLVIVAWWGVAVTVDLSLPNVGWFVAAALILLGVLGLVGVLRSGRPAAQHPLSPAEPTDEPADEPVDDPTDEPADDLAGRTDDLASRTDDLASRTDDLAGRDLAGPDRATGRRPRAPGPDPT
ncbi:MAG TPA: hypothetical protein VFM54_10955 [Micromonosporaceae bacterium]|nr:hypothetical protein [Micromonosporaceae bacterium]